MWDHSRAWSTGIAVLHNPLEALRLRGIDDQNLDNCTQASSHQPGARVGGIPTALSTRLALTPNTPVPMVQSRWYTSREVPGRGQSGRQETNSATFHQTTHSHEPFTSRHPPPGDKRHPPHPSAAGARSRAPLSTNYRPLHSDGAQCLSPRAGAQTSRVNRRQDVFTNDTRQVRMIYNPRPDPGIRRPIGGDIIGARLPCRGSTRANPGRRS